MMFVLLMFVVYDVCGIRTAYNVCAIEYCSCNVSLLIPGDVFNNTNV